MKILPLLFVLIFLSSCSLIKRKGDWGKHAFYPVRGERIITALKKNASSPHVWGGFIGAFTMNLLDFDHKLSDWIADEGHIFKNARSADVWSDNFNNFQKYAVYALIMLTPSQDEDPTFKEYALSKIRGGLLVNVASSSSRFSVEQVRKVVHRRRPNRQDLKSLPSGHAAEAGSRQALISKQLDAIAMDQDLRLGYKGVSTAMALTTLWARVEGKRHYPSDVMAGYALGSFVSGVVYDSLINYDPNKSFVFIPMGNKYTAQYTILF